MAAFALESSAFDNAQAIPSCYSCDAEDVSPPLRWTNVPDGRDRWGSSSMTRMLRAVSSRAGAPGDSIRPPRGWARASRRRMRGRTTSARRGTAVRSPPGHGRHRYVFRLYALDADLELGAGVAKTELQQAIEGRVLTIAELVGTYERGSSSE
jgi:phosphatidylethanolamine-binding protein (PEBP) family uncharacterized protein